MNVDKDIRYELLSRLCPNSTGNNDVIIAFFVYHLATQLVVSFAGMSRCQWYSESARIVSN